MVVALSKDGESREGWRPARLISVAGIRGQDEQEQRATSSLLAVMQAVPDFGWIGKTWLMNCSCISGSSEICSKDSANTPHGRLQSCEPRQSISIEGQSIAVRR